jgi:hypothetical protein
VDLLTHGTLVLQHMEQVQSVCMHHALCIGCINQDILTRVLRI